MRFMTLLLLPPLLAALAAPAWAERQATDGADIDASTKHALAVPARPGARLYVPTFLSNEFRSSNADQQNGPATPPGGARAAGLTGAAPDSNAPTGLAARPHITAPDESDRTAETGPDGPDQTFDSADGDGMIHGLLFLLAALIGTSWIRGMAEPERMTAQPRI